MNADDPSLATPPRNQEGRLACRLDVMGRVSRTDPVRVKFTLRNLGDRTVHVLTWHTPLEGVLSPVFEVSRDGGAPLEYCGPQAMRVAPTSDSYVALPPGSRTETQVEVAPNWDLSAPGVYTISYDGRLLDVATGAAGLPRPFSAHQPLELGRASVQVIVDAE